MDGTDPVVDEDAYMDAGCVADKEGLDRIMTRMSLPEEEEDEMTNDVRVCTHVCYPAGCFTCRKLTA